MARLYRKRKGRRRWKFKTKNGRGRRRSSWRSSPVLVIVLMFGEAVELQSVQLLGHLLCPATVYQLPQLEWSPMYMHKTCT